MKKIFFGLVGASMLFANSLEQIKTSGNIRIGVSEDFAPFSSKNADGNYEGFEISLANKVIEGISNNLGSKIGITFVALDPSDREKALEDNRVDLVFSNITKTPKREELIDFSIPYLSSTIAAVTKKKDHIKSISDLENKRVLCLKGTVIEKFLRQKGFNNIIDCKNTMDCLVKLQNNVADAYVRTNITIAQFPLLDNTLEMSLDSIGGNVDYTAAGIQKGNKELKKAVDDEILKLSKTGYFKELYSSTLEPFYKGTIDKKYLLLDDLYSNMR